MSNKKPCYVGIDLAFAKNKYLPVVVCTWEHRKLIPQTLRRLGFAPPRGKGNAATLDQKVIDRFANDTRLYIESICDLLELHPLRIGIDANTLDLGEIAWGDRHDQLDAYLSAWVASLEEADRMAYGEPPNDAIWIPKIQLPSSNHFTGVHTTTHTIRKPSTGIVLQMLCPGCGKKEFKQWPLGWDAHAAHKCDGLSATTTDERKLEFRRKYLSK